jgi:hypothetical protein
MYAASSFTVHFMSVNPAIIAGGRFRCFHSSRVRFSAAEWMVFEYAFLSSSFLADVEASIRAEGDRDQTILRGWSGGTGRFVSSRLYFLFIGTLIEPAILPFPVVLSVIHCGLWLHRVIPVMSIA